VPQGKVGEEAFAVIRDAMKNKDRVALARVVLTDRGHLTAIEPFGKILVGTILRYGYEVRDERELSRGVAAPKIPNEMVSLPSHILDTKAGHFDPSQFRDEFETELRKLVKRKAAGKTIEAPGREERPPNVVDLIEALRQSVSGKRAAAQIIGIEQEDIEAAIAQDSGKKPKIPIKQPDALEPPVLKVTLQWPSAAPPFSISSSFSSSAPWRALFSTATRAVGWRASARLRGAMSPPPWLALRVRSSASTSA
jgi:hypothetical protein